MSNLVCPTVLVVDDRPAFGRQLKKLLLDKGSIGALLVGTLGEAAALLESQHYRFDAVLTDWLFETGEDPARKLFDGFDLVEFARLRAPSVHAYVVTAHAETEGFQAKAAACAFDLSRMFNKKEINLDDEEASAGQARQPWNKVRSDILLTRIQAADPRLAAELRRVSAEEVSDDDLVGKLLERTLPPTVTYIQDLGETYRVKEPIEVTCAPGVQGSGSVKASAAKLGILVDGFGDTASEAVDSLREVIASHAELLFGQDDGELRDFAKVVKERLARHIERI